MAQKVSGLWTTVLWVGFLVGLLDISAAFVQFSIKSGGKDPLIVLRYIASAVFGREEAFSRDSMIFFGALFHFIIAYCFTIAFFLVYLRIRFLSKSRLLTGVLYGILIWFIMNRIVVPQTKITQGAFRFKDAAIAAGILIAAIGIPLSYLAYRFYYGGSNRNRPAAMTD